MVELIKDLGFPIASVIAMGYFVMMLFNSSKEDNRNIMSQYKEDMKGVISNNEKLADALNTASETQKLLFDRVDKIETEVDHIDDKIDRAISK
ncbi:hypothetical protein G166_gp23 [Clostridium phage phi8074-B1]|uniref:hypothetical protein n=1 Tax=Clostridium phage phi8074-B1 TaxID=1147137 RepID=UPI00025C0C4A|nr:hypothetical protein G166_gp23 [Clostridium phage phi8074-B1]AFC61955.1 hypothetical protein phi8074-B1_00023 [Clostridium phage phi8074-B1]